MPVAAIAKAEFRHAVRSYVLHGLTLLFAGWAGFLAAIQWVPVPYRDAPVEQSALVLLNSMRQSMLFFVPLVGLWLGYGAVVTERERGTLRLALMLPNSRRDVVVGTFLGRAAVIAVAILVGYAPAAVIGAATYGTFDVGLFAAFSVLTAAYGSVYVAIGIGISAALSSRVRALGAAAAMYALVMVLWDAGLVVLQRATIGTDLPESGLPDWIQFVGVLNPSTAFVFAVRSVLPVYERVTFFPFPDAWFYGPGLVVPVLVLWALVPLGVGYARFSRAEL